jgi:hypothetical protein
VFQTQWLPHYEQRQHAANEQEYPSPCGSGIETSDITCRWPELPSCFPESLHWVRPTE